MTTTGLKYGIKTQIWDTILVVLQSNPTFTEVVLFGSRANGNFKPGSDIDICLKGSQISFQDIKLLHDKLDELDLPWKLELLHYESITDPAVIEHIERVGIPL